MSDKRVLVNENSLIAIGSAIREKNGTDASYKPGEMAAAILEIQTGIEPVGDITITENGEYDVVNYAKAIVDVAGSGGGDIEIPVFSGDCSSMFQNDNWTWAVDNFGKQMRTEDIESCSRMFYNAELLKEIPFEINCKGNYSGKTDCGNMFYGCESLTAIPKINGCMPNNLESMFKNCQQIRYFPEDLHDWFDWSGFNNSTGAYDCYNITGIFGGCRSMRSYPMEFLNHENPFQTYATYSIYNSICEYCYALDEMVDMPVHEKWTTLEQSSNLFYSSFPDCHRLKRATFKLYDGAPKAVKWKNQYLDLSKEVGYMGTYHDYKVLNYNSGITNDKKVKDDTTYQALKNDPDWFSCDINYARYNRISAIETINTLPDTSAYLTEKGGTNTIRLRGAAGALTDGGAINTMTEEEIAVAAAKGWTVSFA